MIQHALDINNDINNCVELPKEIRLFNQSFTIEFWIYHKTQGERQIIMGDYQLSGSTNTNFEIYDDNSLRLYWNLGDIDDKFSILEQDKWTHIAWVRSKVNNNQIVYKNGIKIHETKNAGIDLEGTSSLWLGRDSRTTMTLNAIIDELRIWNYARTQEEINNNMNKTVFTYSNGLLAYYRFDNDKNNIIKDYTQNGNNGYANNINLTTNTPNLKYIYEGVFLISYNSSLYTFNGSSIVLSPLQELNQDNFLNNGFKNISDITEEQWDSAFPDKTGLKLLTWTDDLDKTEIKVECEVEPFRPYDKLENEFEICMIS